MKQVICNIYKDRKIIFTETYDDDNCDIKWSYRDYYFNKARYEQADKIVFKFVKSKEFNLNDEVLPF